MLFIGNYDIAAGQKYVIEMHHPAREISVCGIEASWLFGNMKAGCK